MQPLGAPEKAEKTIGNGETFSSCIPKTVEMMEHVSFYSALPESNKASESSREQ